MVRTVITLVSGIVRTTMVSFREVAGRIGECVSEKSGKGGIIK